MEINVSVPGTESKWFCLHHPQEIQTLDLTSCKNKPFGRWPHFSCFKISNLLVALIWLLTASFTSGLKSDFCFLVEELDFNDQQRCGWGCYKTRHKCKITTDNQSAQSLWFVSSREV